VILARPWAPYVAAVLVAGAFLAGTGALVRAVSKPVRSDRRLSDYVRPLIGTRGEGNTFPGPSVPFGMVQFSPDTDNMNWRTASGYEYSDPTIMGFSCTHLSGTGIPDLGDFLFVPQVGDVKWRAGARDGSEPGYRQKYSHADEEARTGYYGVRLANGASAELAAAEHAGMMRFTFPAGDSSLLIDLTHVLHSDQTHVVWSDVRVRDRQTVTGSHLVNGWAKDRSIHFAARYSKPFDDYLIVSGGKPQVYNTYRFRSRNEAFGDDVQFLARYKTHADEQILVKIGISSVSAEGALKNLDADIPGWDFEGLVEDTRQKWDRELSKIEIEGSDEQKETFYTSVYHAFLAPNVYQDVDGEYRGLDGDTHSTHDAHGKESFTRYSVFSLWDTFRAEHPLFALTQAKRDADMINSMLAHFDQSVDHVLPMWELDGNETWCMIGYHAVPVIVDAFLKGIQGFDSARAYEAIKTTALNPDYDGVAQYAALGWVPSEKEPESLSKTLEYAYDDFAIAQMASALGKTDDAKAFVKRSGSFKNLFDPTMGWMRPKDSAGHWRTPFAPRAFWAGDGRFPDVTEGTSAQYTWFVPHDVPALIALMGGPEKFVKRLDEIFESDFIATDPRGNVIPGWIGEYWHGNEPSHHIAYLYAYAGEPAKTAQRIHKVMATQYGNKPDSLSGNDDCGQMSAWYIFASLGFYPVCPTCNYYVIGSPSVSKAVVHLSNGKDLMVTAEGVSDSSIYVQSVKVNGQPLETPFLPYASIKDGGSLAFTMGSHPSPTWGVHPGAPPAQLAK
jgi:predicted alpha-1,2-mannosidase